MDPSQESTVAPLPYGLSRLPPAAWQPRGSLPTPTRLLAAPQVPTLRTISEDMDKVKLGSNAVPGKEIYDTGLAPYVQYMDRFLSRLGDAARAEKVREITANKQSSLDF
jgi:hypothetical protein